MSLVDAVRSGLSKYATFEGRALRSEYWYFVLALILATVVAEILDAIIIGRPVLAAIVALGTIVPSIAVACRRLHDTDRSGWWQLITFVPLIGTIVLIVWLASQGTGDNRFGRALA
ncbi:MAG: DUF805 domain-containing protein [Roseiarcus sp.]|jgi:uncharacterized membrane protein YhaH (DUF805 family)